MKPTQVLKAALLGGLALAATAKADVHTYEYTAVVSAILELELDTHRLENVDLTTMPGFAIQIRDTIHGRFSIDTATQFSSSDTFGDGVSSNYSDFTNKNSLSIGFDKSGHQFGGLGPLYTNLNITDQPQGSGDDVVHLSVGTYAAGPRQGIQIDLTDSSGSALSQATIPNSLAGFPVASFLYSYDTGVGPGYTSVAVGGDFTAWREVSAVPEPGTWAMLLAGLGLLGWQRQRSARKQ
jgi:hypothetical protein